MKRLPDTAGLTFIRTSDIRKLNFDIWKNLDRTFVRASQPFIYPYIPWLEPKHVKPGSYLRLVKAGRGPRWDLFLKGMMMAEARGEKIVRMKKQINAAALKSLRKHRDFVQRENASDCYLMGFFEGGEFGTEIYNQELEKLLSQKKNTSTTSDGVTG